MRREGWLEGQREGESKGISEDGVVVSWRHLEASSDARIHEPCIWMGRVRQNLQRIVRTGQVFDDLIGI